MSRTVPVRPVDTEDARRPVRRRVAIPPQHGAWAFLVLPLVVGLVLVGGSVAGVVFAVTWVLAYPASYYAGRALTTRIRRGSWTRIALRERANAVPWLIAVAPGALILAWARPWLLVAGGLLAIGWAAGIWLSLAGRERGLTNDMVLVGQSLVALPLLWMVTADDPAVTAVPGSVWLATLVCGVYFVGSVIHVKSLIRESDDRRWRIADLVFHTFALSLAWVSAWLLIPFGACLIRSAVMRPSMRPAAIGAVEIVMSALVGVCTIVGVS